MGITLKTQQFVAPAVEANQKGNTAGALRQKFCQTSKWPWNLLGLRAFAVSAQVLMAERARVEAAQGAALGLTTYELDLLLAKARRPASAA